MSTIVSYRLFFVSTLLGLLSACVGVAPQPPCAADRQDIENCPPAEAVADSTVAEQQRLRRWHKPDELGFDPIELGMAQDTPLQQVNMRIIGSSYQSSVHSLASKIWLIDHAQHTVDATYYIFKADLVGNAVLGALCNAVIRGVDVRLMVDSLGSFDLNRSEMKALSSCAIEGGFVKNAQGEVTTTKARVQAVVFNATSKVLVNINRRSHDKLLLVDAAFPEKAWAMTGGRNISLDYYGLNTDGTPDLTAYKDMEILLRPAAGVGISGKESVGQLSEYYYSLIFSHNRNKKLTTGFAYGRHRAKFDESLRALHDIPDFEAAYEQMPDYLAQMKPGIARLAHELENLGSSDVVNAYDSNVEHNPNSIMGLLRQAEKRQGVVRIVSPYLFLQRYERTDGTVYYDGKDSIFQWLDAYPDSRIEIITNSVLTSDNFFAQAMIDMEAAPRLLLPAKQRAIWRNTKLEDGEFNNDLVESKLWREMVSNPQIKIYQTGRLDSQQLGGDTHYGKLHAKFVLVNSEAGFVGTSNFDYRSILFNNEVGYFFRSDFIGADLLREFELLKSQSYRWGSPEWLQLRKKIVAAGGGKAKIIKKQHSHYEFLQKTGLKWQF